MIALVLTVWHQDRIHKNTKNNLKQHKTVKTKHTCTIRTKQSPSSNNHRENSEIAFRVIMLTARQTAKQPHWLTYGKVCVDLYSVLSYIPLKHSGKTSVLRRITQFCLPPNVGHWLHSPAAEHHCLRAGTHCICPRRDGQAELTYVAGYILR